MNSIMVIAPYRHLGMWVFDDEAAGLVQEPFVGGADAIIDRAVESIPEADNGFRLIFSANPFPGYGLKLEWVREELSGNTYYSPDFHLEGWFCPALFKYFEEAPPALYAKFEALKKS